MESFTAERENIMLPMKRLIISIGLFLSTAGLAGADRPDPASRMEQLKQSIRSIASANTSRTDNFLEVRNQLQPLVNELLALAPDRLEAEKLPQVVGAWRNLWSDMPFGEGVDPTQVYQAVSSAGYYYNISRIVTAQGEFTGFLRGAYSDQGSYLDIEFTANSISPDFFAPGTQLLPLAEAFEAQTIPGTSIPGPIGVKGVLINAYVDQDLRIVTGNSVSGTDLNLFILERADAIVP
jgi:hypothetical protein